MAGVTALRPILIALAVICGLALLISGPRFVAWLHLPPGELGVSMLTAFLYAPVLAVAFLLFLFLYVIVGGRK